MEFSRKWKIELPYDLIIPLLGIYPEKNIIWKDTCTPMSIAALFAIAKTQKQPKMSIDRGRDEDVALIYNRILLSHWREWNNAIFSNMESVILSEGSQRSRNFLLYPLHVDSKRKWCKWIYLQNRNRVTDLGNKLTVAGSGGEGTLRDLGWTCTHCCS